MKGPVNRKLLLFGFGVNRSVAAASYDAGRLEDLLFFRQRWQGEARRGRGFLGVWLEDWKKDLREAVIISSSRHSPVGPPSSLTITHWRRRRKNEQRLNASDIAWLSSWLYLKKYLKNKK